MQTATLTPPARTMTADRPREGLRLPANSLLGVIDDPAALRAVLAALAGAGIDPAGVEVVTGTDGARRLGAGNAGGRLGRLRDWLQALGPEPALRQRYARELAAGHALLVVRDPRPAGEGQVRDILLANGGHCIQHYGRFTVALLAP
jgi:hypothetical protein